MSVSRSIYVWISLYICPSFALYLSVSRSRSTKFCLLLSICLSLALRINRNLNIELCYDLSFYLALLFNLSFSLLSNFFPLSSTWDRYLYTYIIIKLVLQIKLRLTVKCLLCSSTISPLSLSLSLSRSPAHCLFTLYICNLGIVTSTVRKLQNIVPSDFSHKSNLLRLCKVISIISHRE